MFKSFISKILVFIIIILVIIILIAKSANLNFCKNYLIRLAKDHGLELRIDDDLKINLFPNISLESTGPIIISDLHNHQKLIEVKTLGFKLELLALAFGQINSEEIYLKSFKLYSDNQTLNNLKNKFRSLEKDTEKSDKKSKMKFSLNKLTIENSEIFHKYDRDLLHIYDLNFEVNPSKKAKFSFRSEFDKKLIVVRKGKIENFEELMDNKFTKIKSVIGLYRYFPGFYSVIHLESSIKNLAEDLILDNVDLYLKCIDESFDASDRAIEFKGKIDLKKKYDKIFLNGTLNLDSLTRLPEDLEFLNRKDKEISQKEIFSKKNFDLSFLNKLQGKINLNSDGIRIYDIKLDEVKANIILDNGKAKINLTQANIGDGRLNSNLEFSSSNNHYQFDLNSSNIRIEEILANIVNKGEITGKGDIKIHLAGFGHSPYLLAKNSKGHISTIIRNGKINSSKIPQKILNMAKLEFDQINFDWQVRDGMIYDNGSRIKSHLVDLELKGNINLFNKALNYNIIPKKIYHNDIMSEFVTINIGGYLDDPKITYGTKQMLDGIKKNLTKKILKDKILKNDKILDKTIGNFLDKLL